MVCWALQYFSLWECQSCFSLAWCEWRNDSFFRGYLKLLSELNIVTAAASADCVQKCQTGDSDAEPTRTWSLCCTRDFISVKLYKVFMTSAKGEEKKKTCIYFIFTTFFILALENFATSLFGIFPWPEEFLRLALHVCIWKLPREAVL